jgi:hypothetical protein
VLLVYRKSAERGAGNTSPGLPKARRNPVPKAVANIASIAPLHNLQVRAVVDQLGALKAEIAEIEVREKALRNELLRRGVTEAEGALFSAAVTQAVRWTLDTKSVKAEMGARWWDARCRQSLVTTVAVKPRIGVTKVAA